MWGAQLVPIEILATFLYNLVPNCMKIMSNKKASASQTFWQDHA